MSKPRTDIYKIERIDPEGAPPPEDGMDRGSSVVRCTNVRTKDVCSLHMGPWPVSRGTKFFHAVGYVDPKTKNIRLTEVLTHYQEEHDV